MDPNSYLSTSGGTMRGGLEMADNNVTRPKLKDFSYEILEHGVITNNTTINIENGNVQSATIGNNLTLTFSNPIASGDASAFLLELTNGGAYTLTFPASVKWPSGSAPVLSGFGVDILAFYTVDGGTTWRGALASALSKSP